MRLPEIFGMVDGVIPMRIYVYAAHQYNTDNLQKVEACPLSPDNNATIAQQSFPDGPFKWNLSCGLSRFSAVFWNTGYVISSDNNLFPPIPIYDFENRADIFQNIYMRPFPLYQVSNVTAAMIYGNIRDIRPIMLNSAVYNPARLAPSAPPAITSAPASAPAPASAAQLPKHVLQALIRAAILDKKSCPISMTEFEEIQEFGITPCYHIFDKEAVERWISTHSTCPECRANCASIIAIKQN